MEMCRVSILENNIPDGSSDQITLLPFGTEDSQPMGLIVVIEPPVDLDPRAVSNYLTTGNIQGDAPHDREGPIYDFNGPVLVDTSDDKTQLYVSPWDISRKAIEADKALLAERTTELLGSIGIDAEVVG